MILDLVQDFAAVLEAMPEVHPRRRMLTLIDESLRRDAQFIDRHPTTLFQSLWNTCWWYDCPVAEPHYSSAARLASRQAGSLFDDTVAISGLAGLAGACMQRITRLARAAVAIVRRWKETVTGYAWHDVAGSDRTDAGPWTEPGPKLYLLLEQWRAAKLIASPGFRWMRSRRPPAIHLESPLRLILAGHEDRVTSVAFSRDGQALFSRAADRTIRMWDLVRGEEILCISESHSSSSLTDTSRRGRRLTIEREAATTVVRDADTFEEVCRLSGPVERQAGVLVDSRAGRSVSATRDFELTVTDAHTGAALLQFQCYDAVACVSLSPDGRWLGTGSVSGAVRIWDTASPHRYRPLRGDETRLAWMALSPDSRTVLTPSSGYGLRAWDALSGHELRRLCREPLPIEAQIRVAGPAAFTPDGQRIVCIINQSHPYVFTAKGRLERQLRPDRAASDMLLVFRPSLAISHDGRRIACHLSDATVRVWDLESGQQLRTYYGNRAVKSALCFSADGARLAAAWGDGTVRICELETELAPRSLAVPEPATGIEYAAAGDRLVVTSRKSTWIYDVATGDCRLVSDSGGDARAIALGLPAHVSQLRNRVLDSIVEDSASGHPLAFLPDICEQIVSYPGQNTWARAAGNYLSIFSLDEH